MCIVFIYSGFNDAESDYSLIVAANRDLYYDRLAKDAGPWDEDPKIIGGRDMAKGCEGGTWMAYSLRHMKLGLLLNLPGNKTENPKSRGKIVENFVKNDSTVEEYIESIKDYGKETSDFAFVAVNFSKFSVQTYNNVTEKLENWPETYLGFSNSPPDRPLKKVTEGKVRFEQLCNDNKRTNKESDLINGLYQLLRWDERHLPDEELKKKNPFSEYEKLSSVFVDIPEVKYGTRTHSIFLLTKTGKIRFIENTRQQPVNPDEPATWTENDYIDYIN